MTVRLIVDGEYVDVDWVRFSDGTSNVKVGECNPKRYVTILVSPRTEGDAVFWEVAMLLDAVERVCEDVGRIHFSLKLPYLPHARADRVFEKGNALPLKLFVSLFSYFDKVYLTDPHSEIDPEWHGYTDVEVRHQASCFIGTIPVEKRSNIVIVAPDQGALPKIQHLAQRLDFYNYDNVEIVYATKKRCVSTGQIVAIDVPETDLTGKRCMIVDDICDGGGTFLGLAKRLREMNPESIDLYVTHGIFSKGLEPFKGLIDRIYMHQAVGKFVTWCDIQNFNEGEL